MRKGIRKHERVTTIKKVTENLTMLVMFERFMWFKQSKGLAFRKNLTNIWAKKGMENFIGFKP